jgi:hypothetical protein
MDESIVFYLMELIAFQIIVQNRQMKYASGAKLNFLQLFIEAFSRELQPYIFYFENSAKFWFEKHSFPNLRFKFNRNSKSCTSK